MCQCLEIRNMSTKCFLFKSTYLLKKDSAEYFAVEFEIPSCLVNTRLMVNGSILDRFEFAFFAHLFSLPITRATNESQFSLPIRVE